MITQRVFIIFACIQLLIFAGICRGGDPQSASAYFGHINAACVSTPDKTSKEFCDELKEYLRSLKTECTTIDVKCRPGEEILRRIFGPVQRKTLADFIIYFDQSLGAGKFTERSPALLWRDKITPHLYGVRNVYAVVFTEYKVDLKVRLTTDYKREPNPLAGLSEVLGAKGQVPDEPPSVSKQGEFLWYPLTGNSDDTDMWLAIARMGVDVNTINRITVSYDQPKPRSIKIVRKVTLSDGASHNNNDKVTKKDTATTKENSKSNIISEEKEDVDERDAFQKKDTTTSFEVSDDRAAENDEGMTRDATLGKESGKYTGNFLAANGFFSNSPDSRAAVSLAIGVTFNDKGTAASSGGNNQSFNGYALAKFYIIPPMLLAGPQSGPGAKKAYSSSLGVVLGTNMARSVFDEFVVGFSFGHLVGNAGLVVGANFIAGEKDSSAGRKTRPLIAIEYTF